MSWHISQAMMDLCGNLPSSPGLAAESSADTCSDGEPSAPSRSNPIQRGYCSPDRMTAFSRLSQFGMTFQPLTASHGEELLTWFRAGFPVRTFPQQEAATDSTESEAGCGQKWPGSFAKFDRDTHLWRTHQSLLLGGWESFSETLPRWGIMQDGECLALTMPDMTTKGTGCGLLPTMLATDWKGGTTAIRKDKGAQRFDQWRDYIKIKFGMTYPHPTHSECRMGWPLGWTDLKPLAMDKFRLWINLHGKS